MNAVEALDDYLVELLADVAPAAASPLGATAGATSVTTADIAPVATEVAPAIVAADPATAPPAPAMLDIDANTAALLAEMDADPAFADAPVGAASAATIAPAAAAAAESVGAKAPPTEADRIAAALLAEMDADPAFACAPVGAASAATIAPAAAAESVGAEAPPTEADRIAAALLAEMDADPAFAGGAPAAAAPPPKRATPMPPIARRPAPRASRLPANIQALFQPAPQAGDLHRRAADRSTRWLRLRCAGQTYALELLKVQEVVLPVPLLPLRGAARSFLGIMNLRGQVVPVLDLGLHLGAGAVEQDAQTRVVVLEENGETMGLRVSAVDDVASLTDQQIEPPDTTRLCRISNHLFRGVARIGAQPVILLDATQLLH